MPRRVAISLEDVASLDTLARAFQDAARGKRHRPDVAAFGADLLRRLERLGQAIRTGKAPAGRWTEFHVWDPKPRRILAPCFEDRVLHHALMLHLEPVLDRALVSDTFACRQGGGTLAAVRRAQQHLRRFGWFVKLDVRAYFASIRHDTLLAILGRRFKGPGVLSLCERILASSPDGTRQGLPIGALTSQHFANTYLDGLDRFLLDAGRARGLVRYMDDVVLWHDSRDRAREALASAEAYLRDERGLSLHPRVLLGRSEAGVPFLGFRVLPFGLRLSLRRRRRYAAARARWERRYHEGSVDELGLQRGYASALAITAHADALGFRRAEHARRPFAAQDGTARMGHHRVIRGGSWNDDARNCRAANRNWNAPEDRNDNVGFRLARAHEQVGGPALDPSGTAFVAPGAGETPKGPGVEVAAADAPSNPHREPAYFGPEHRTPAASADPPGGEREEP